MAQIDAGQTPEPNAIYMALGSGGTAVGFAVGLAAGGLRVPIIAARVTPRLVRFIVDAGRLVQQRAPQWALPTLLLYAGADRCVAPAGSARLAAAAPPAWLQARRYDGMAHELFNEPDRARVLSDLSTWLAALPATPPASRRSPA